MTVFLKYVSLAILVIQTTALVLILRYSRTVPQQGPRYLASTTIVLSEFLKLIACLTVLLSNCGWSFMHLVQLLHQEIFCKPKETLKGLIPAGLYTVQNNFLFLALSNLDAATYQVTYQLKILVTAMFSVTMLHKKLELTQCFALALLMFGVALVQLPSGAEITHSEASESNMSSQVLGLCAVLTATVTSSFSGVYFEKIVKSSSQSLWICNVQLGMFALILAWTAVVVQDYNAIMTNGFFQGYYITTWIVIILQAFGGLVVATVIKYADNILKGFATSVSIVLSTVCSYYLLSDFSPTSSFFTGATIVIIATMLYGCPITLKLPCSVKANAKNEQKNSS